jgi:hypothetical protein
MMWRLAMWVTDSGQFERPGARRGRGPVICERGDVNNLLQAPYPDSRSRRFAALQCPLAHVLGAFPSATSLDLGGTGSWWSTCWPGSSGSTWPTRSSPGCRRSGAAPSCRPPVLDSRPARPAHPGPVAPCTPWISALAPSLTSLPLRGCTFHRLPACLLARSAACTRASASRLQALQRLSLQDCQGLLAAGLLAAACPRSSCAWEPSPAWRAAPGSGGCRPTWGSWTSAFARHYWLARTQCSSWAARRARWCA